MKYTVEVLRLATCWNEYVPSTFHSERQDFDNFEEAYMTVRRVSSEAEKEAAGHPRHNVGRKDLLGKPTPNIIEEIHHTFGSERGRSARPEERNTIQVIIQLKKGDDTL